jgi:integrase
MDANMQRRRIREARDRGPDRWSDEKTNMAFALAHVSAALATKVDDNYMEGRRAWLRPNEKGGKRHKVPAHRIARKYLDASLDAAGITGQKNPPSSAPSTLA